MASTSETGHSKNVANFDELLSFCIGYGSKFDPSKANLKIPALQTQLGSVRTNVATVTNTSVAYNNAVNSRMIAFEGLKKLSTRLVNALDATGATKELVKDAKTINTKLQGARANSGKPDVLKKAKAPLPDNAVTETPKIVSTSQQSYDSLIEHFSKMITLLATEPTYLPNEAELKVGALNTTITSLKNSNTAVVNAYTTVSNARIARNQSLYNPDNGLCAVAKEVKMYVKSVFGATSPQYKQISGIEFKAIKS